MVPSFLKFATLNMYEGVVTELHVTSTSPLFMKSPLETTNFCSASEPTVSAKTSVPALFRPLVNCRVSAFTVYLTSFNMLTGSEYSTSVLAVWSADIVTSARTDRTSICRKKNMMKEGFIIICMSFYINFFFLVCSLVLAGYFQILDFP